MWLIPSHGEVALFDAELMAPARIIEVWGISKVLLLGTDNPNVLACANEGYVGKGDALILNMETENGYPNGDS